MSDGASQYYVAEMTLIKKELENTSGLALKYQRMIFSKPQHVWYRQGVEFKNVYNSSIGLL